MFYRRPLTLQLADNVNAMDAQAAWAIHLHQQIHIYLRTTQLSVQVLGTATVAALVATAQHQQLFPYVVLALPYALGIAMQIEARAQREVETCAGVIVFLELDMRDRAGEWVLYQESAFSASRPVTFADKLGRTLFQIAVLGVGALSIWTGFEHAHLLSPGGAITNAIAIVTLYTTVTLSIIAARGARQRVRLSIERFTHSR